MKQTLPALTSVRFFAALAVVVAHRPHVDPDDWLPYEWHAPALVTFFFLLSGFILTYVYHDRFLARRPGVGRAFLRARAARLLPAYALAFGLALWVGDEGQSLRTLKLGSALWQALAHLALLQAWVPDPAWYFAFNPPAWSLSCEWFFYLTFPLLLLGLATGSIPRRLAVFGVFAAVWGGVLGLYLADPGAPARDGWRWMWLGSVCPLTRAFDFACGVVLGVLFVRLKPEVGPARGWRYWGWGLVELGALAGLWATLHFAPVSPTDRGAVLRFHLLAGLGYYLPALALVVWVGARGRGPLSRAVSWSPLVYLGELSYGVYIFHAPIIVLVTRVLDPQGGAASVVVGCAVSGAVTVAVSALSYHFWETPIRRRICRRPAEPAGAPELPLLLPFPRPHADRRAA